MSNKKFGELKKVSMQEAGQDEARDFTPWLHDNIGALGKALDMTLYSINREERIGDFWLDLLAEDDNGRTVAIENQFNSTDHSHLGQLLTYAAGCDANVLIWVTEKVRDGHRAAVEWLNRKTNPETEFYLVKVEVLQIDNSPLAYQFIPVVASNKWQKEAHQQVVAKTPEDAISRRHFQQFVKDLEEKNFPFKLRSHHSFTPHRHFFCKARRWVYGYEIRDGYARVYVYLSYTGGEEAQKVHDELVARKKVIEGKWGRKLEWDEWNNYSIGIYRPCSLSESEESLAKIRAWAVKEMFKLAEAIPPTMLQEIAAKLDAKESAE